LFFIMGITILSFSILITNCGSGPQQKNLADNGQYAIDFSVSPPIDLSVSPPRSRISFVSLGQSILHMTNTDFTIEAWVKTVSSTPGSIFSRESYGGGILTHINNNNVPCISTVFGTYGALQTYQACATSSPLTVGRWDHVAFVMCHSNLGCNDGHATTSPHLDTYVNGVLAASAGTLNALDWSVDTGPGAGVMLNEWIGRRHFTPPGG
jgi:hypothetical protein